MSNKCHCSSCESLKEQIEEIKKGQIEDCQKQNEDNKRRLVGMQGKIMALTIASTVAFTVVGQEAVEKIQKLIESITSVQNVANPDAGESVPDSDKQSSNTRNPDKIRNPNMKDFIANSNKNIFLEESSKYEGPYRIYTATSSDDSSSETSSFIPTRIKPRSKTSSNNSMESIVQPEQLPEAVPAIDLAVSDLYATPPVISFSLTSTQLPDVDMTPDYRMGAISVVPAPSTVSSFVLYQLVKPTRRRI